MEATRRLNDPDSRLDAESRAQLMRTIDAKTVEMCDLISNVLDLMSFEVGRVHLRREWHCVEELVRTALGRLEGRFGEQRTPLNIRRQGHGSLFLRDSKMRRYAL
jgi:two-component system, OmpR family, sensor histidine kinase KdpD